METWSSGPLVPGALQLGAPELWALELGALKLFHFETLGANMVSCLVLAGGPLASVLPTNVRGNG